MAPGAAGARRPLALPELPVLVVTTVTMTPVSTGPGVLAPAVVVEVGPEGAPPPVLA